MNIEKLDSVLVNGGEFKVDGVKMFVDNPLNFEQNGVRISGYWIVSASGFKVYFYTKYREKAQAVCDKVFGSGMYKVNSKI